MFAHLPSVNWANWYLPFNCERLNLPVCLANVFLSKPCQCMLLFPSNVMG